METTAPQGPFCQSCGMPLQEPQDYGSNEDGGRNGEYCRFCYQYGRFTEPNITMQQMIDKISDIMSHTQHMPEEQARTLAKDYMPQLKRWRKREAA